MATTMWIGGAPVVEHVGTITIANTWAANDTLTVTINGKIMTLTVGTAAATTDVATALQAAWEGTSLGAGYSVNFTGQECAEFYELISSVNGSVVTLTERAAGNASGFTEGKTFTIAGGTSAITAGETTAGTGTATYATTKTPTGPHHATDNANWSTGVAASEADTAIFTGDYDCKYAIDRSGDITNGNIRVLGSYTGQLGLPRLRSVLMPDGQTQIYEEYRDQYFKVGTGGTITLWVGDGEGDGPTMVKVDPNTSAITAYIRKTGDPEIDGEPVVFLKNGATTSQVFVAGGEVGIAFYPDETATHEDLSVSQDADGDTTNVQLGFGYSLASGDLAIDGGTVTSHGIIDADTITVGAGGTLTLNDITETTCDSMKVHGGTVNFNCAGTITALVASGTAVLNFASFMRSVTVTNATFYTGVTLQYGNIRPVVWTNPIQVTGCGLGEITWPSGVPSTDLRVEVNAI